MLLNGKLTISRIDLTDEVRIRLRDTDSGIEFLEVCMTLENYALVLTGLGHVECGIRFTETAPLGKIRQFKTELVPHPTATESVLRDIQAAQLIAPYEVDGWKAHMPDMFNGNKAKRTGDNGEWMQEVGFIRYVEKTSQTDPNSAE